MATGGGGGGTSASAIEAGGAFVTLYTKDEKLKAGLDKAKAMVQSFATKMAGVGAGIAAAGSVVVAPLTKLFWDSVEGAADAGKAAERWGESVERMSAFAYAARMPVEDLNGLLVHFSERVHEAAAGGGEMADKFAEAGLNAAELEGMLPIDQVLRFADAVQQAQTVGERFALEKLGGRAFHELDDALRKGSAGLLERMEKAQRLGAVYTQAEADNARKVKAAWKDSTAAISNAFEQLGRSLIEPLAGPIQQVAGWIEQAAVAVRGFVVANKEVVVVVAAVGGTLVALGTALVAAAGALAIVTAAVGVLMTPLAATVAVVGFVVAGFVALAAAVGVGIYQLVTGTETGKAAFGAFADIFSAAWGGIVDAVKSGNLSLAFQIAWDAIKLVWLKGVLALTKVWNDFKAEIVDGWREFVYAAEWAWAKIRGISTEALDAQLAAEKKARADARKADEDAARADVQRAAIRLGFDRIKAAKEEKKSAEAALAGVGRQMESFRISGTFGGFQKAGFAQTIGGASVPALLTKVSGHTEKTAKNTGDILAEMKKQDEKEEVFE